MTAANPFPVTGPDLVDVDDLDPLASETTSEVQNLSQDCLHWLICLPGGNLDNKDRGVGALTYLSGTTEQLATLPAATEADFVKDPRIVACSASLQPQPDATFQILVEVQPTAGGVLAFTYGYTQQGGMTLV